MSTCPEKALFWGEGITKRYEGTPVLEEASLELAGGKLVSLLGPSGAGKTTLFNVLAGVDVPDHGRVMLAGEDVTGLSGKVSYMLQKDLLLEYRTVLDNVILPLLIRREPKKKAEEYAAGFFAQFGLSGCEGKYPGQLSGGMRQRAALLRTCMMNNRVILLDEPFSALDAITRFQMQRWYLDIAGALGLSTLFITHDIDEALTLSDTVYILNRKPARIILTLDIQPPRPREKTFSLSPEFAGYKRRILDALGL